MITTRNSKKKEKVLFRRFNSCPAKSQKSRSFPWQRPLGPHQGFALNPLGASRRSVDPLPNQLAPPLTLDPGSAPGSLIIWWRSMSDRLKEEEMDLSTTFKGLAYPRIVKKTLSDPRGSEGRPPSTLRCSILSVVSVPIGQFAL